MALTPNEAITPLMDEISLAKFNMAGIEYHSTVTRIELAEAIEQLPPIYREVVELFYRQENSISEIATEHSHRGGRRRNQRCFNHTDSPSSRHGQTWQHPTHPFVVDNRRA